VLKVVDREGEMKRVEAHDVCAAGA
jgi:hypothetical protein